MTGLRHLPERDEVIAQSARNRFQGIVTRVVKDEIVAKVELQAGPYRVVSLMTREAADELALAPRDLAVAAVKATNVVIDCRRRHGASRPRGEEASCEGPGPAWPRCWRWRAGPRRLRR